MATKACKQCRTLFESGSKCPVCGGEGVDGFKGHIEVLDPEQSEIARELKIIKKGSFAIRLR